MPRKQAASPTGKLRETLARNDKAWKLVHALRDGLPGFTDPELIDVLQMMDDTEWEALRLATKPRPIKPTSDKGTSCTVSRPVKALIYAKLRGDELTPRIAEPGADALPPEHRVGLRLIRGEEAAG